MSPLKHGDMTNVSLPLGTDLSYLVLVVVFFWIAYAFMTFLAYRKKLAAERASGSGGAAPGRSANAGGFGRVPV